ncbi:helix-turn-helix domain-containing protein [Nocardia sp. XZ_19_385]|uniref:AraC family transcriptional regulator n=1 Tax=Nocardia sp. XZ_19_385 TaxID=2769488 RepID=UPI00188FAE35|nr:helix-turn-helix domain-containing protein [Nocardia sp. XZ_19_385]
MVEQARSWRIERNGNAAFVALGAEFACIGENSAAEPKGFRHPAWQLVLSAEAPVLVRDELGGVTSGPGILVSPRVFRTFSYPAGYVSLWIDPYRLSGPPGLHALDSTQVTRLLTGLGTELEPDRLRAAVDRTLGMNPPLDPRLAQALDLLDGGDPAAELAARVGLSPRRLRQLGAATLGCSLPTLRRWHRLREAVVQLPFRPAAEVAARTGFADQSHLVRTTVAMGGVTPGAMFSRWQAPAPERNVGIPTPKD